MRAPIFAVLIAKKSYCRISNCFNNVYMEKFVILDNGHGAETPGKRSPDGKHREWRWCRDTAADIAARLLSLGIESSLLVPEDSDVPLSVRCRRANALAALHPGAVLVSIHNNAAGNGSRWLGASGWCVFVAPEAGEHARRLAALLHCEAAARKLLGNRAPAPCGWLEAPLAICRHTKCPAVLTENMFQDNPGDVAFLASAQGKDAIASLHVAALLKYFNNC